MKKIYTLLIACIGTLSLTQLGAQNSCIQCGTGSNGAFTASANTTLAGGTYNYTSFTIVSGVTVTVTGTQPLIIRCTGAAVINGILDASGGNGTNGITSSAAGVGGTGVAGGANGGNGNFSVSVGAIPAQNGAGAGGVGTGGGGWSGGGGAGYSTVGTASGNSAGGFAGPVYGNTQLMAALAGSGGGGGSGGFSCGSGGGGAGGGYIEITACANLTIGATGIIRANGGNGGSDGTGNCGGGGGGSGGAIRLGAPAVVNNGQIRAIGGTGGASAIPGAPYFGVGGNGGNGRIRIDGALSGTGNAIPVTVFSAPVLVINTSSADTICSGGSSTVVALGSNSPAPYTYNWMPGNLNGSSVTVSPTATTVYTVTVTDSLGCSNTNTVGVFVNPLPVVSIGADTAFCATVNPHVLTAQTSALIYLWSTGATSQSISVSSGGT
ncbi:MAG: hypothetical protein ACRC3B_13215, partial [Bacteroidia bacterium]